MKKINNSANKFKLIKCRQCKLEKPAGMFWLKKNKYLDICEDCRDETLKLMKAAAAEYVEIPE